MERLYLTQKHRSVLLKNHPFIGMVLELESDFLSCQLLVDISKGVCLVFNIGLLGLVQMNLKETGSIKPDLDSLSNNLSWVDEVVQDAVMDGQEGAGSWPLLLQLVGLPGGFGKNPSLGDENHMLSTELLLKFSDQPSLNLLEGLELRNRNEDDNSLLSPTAFLLTRPGLPPPNGDLRLKSMCF